MPIRGDLRTMPLVELLQWVGANSKTGVLELERNKIRRTIAFRQGRIVGCASTAPSALLGHTLISRGKINERSLQYALKQAEGSGRRLSDVLVEMGLVTDDECTEALSDSAAETVYGLFEWQDAIFRFDADGQLDQCSVADLSVDHILMSGAQRQDELDRVRGIFNSSGVVLGRTNKSLPANPEDADLVYPVLELVNGERTVAEIVVKAHASEFQVLRMLFMLHGNGNVEILAERELKDAATLLDVGNMDEPVELPSLADLAAELPGVAPAGAPRAAPTPAVAPPTAPVAAATDGPLDDMEAMVASIGDDVDVAEPVVPVETPVTESAPENQSAFSEPAELDILMEFASEKLERGDHEGALTMLDTCYKARPDDDSLKRLMLKAEAGYLEKVRKYLLGPEKVAIRDLGPDEPIPNDLDPAERSILELVDGKNDVQSICWTAPLREVEVMRALQGLSEKQVIHLVSPVSA